MDRLVGMIGQEGSISQELGHIRSDAVGDQANNAAKHRQVCPRGTASQSSNARQVIKTKRSRITLCTASERTTKSDSAILEMNDIEGYVLVHRSPSPADLPVKIKT